jgi:mRNA interferase HigB
VTVWVRRLATILGAGYTASVRIIARRTLREFWLRHADAEEALRAWFADTRRAHWKTPAEVRATYANASIVGNNRVVFNIRGNNYRLVVAIRYELEIVYIRFVGTHAEYDQDPLENKGVK